MSIESNSTPHSARRRARAILALGTIAVAIVAIYLWKRPGATPPPREPARAAVVAPAAPSALPSSAMTDGVAAPDGEPTLHAPDPSGGLALEGVVFGPDDQAVGGATVHISTVPPRAVTTDANGAFTIDRLLHRRYRVFATAAAGIAGPLDLMVTDTTEPVILQLRPAGRIVARVLDPDGKPVADARIDATTEVLVEATTGADGTATLAPISTGTWSVRARKRGLASEARWVAVGPESTAEVELQLTTGVPLAGRVLDERGAPLADVRVWPEEAGDVDSPRVGAGDAVVSGRDGQFRFEALPPAAYRLHAYVGGRPKTVSKIIALSPAGKDDVELRMDLGATLRGRVIDVNGRPAAAVVRIDVESTGGVVRAQTDDDGGFAVVGLPRAAVSLRATADAASSDPQAVDLTTGDARVELKLIHTLRIAGVVVDSTGEPVLGAQVIAWAVTGDARWREITDAGGRFELRGLAAGSHDVAAGRERALQLGHRNRLPGVRVMAGTIDVRIVLPAGGGLTGEVIGSDGKPPASYRVRLQRVNGVPFVTPRFTLSDVPPGTYSVRIEGSGFATKRVDGVEVRSGQVTDLGRLEIMRGRTIAGRVMNASGTPVAGAKVRGGAALVGNGDQVGTDGGEPDFAGAAQTTTTDDTGSFELTGVSPGRWTVVAEAGESGRSSPLAIAGGTESVTGVTLVVEPVASLSGTVTIDGKPGSAVVNAQPHATPFAMAAVPAGRDGEFRFDRLAPGRYAVSIVIGDPVSGGTFHPHGVELAPGKPQVVALKATTGDGTIEVTVTGSPIAVAFATSVPLEATNAQELVERLGRQDGGAWGLVPVLGGPGTLGELAGGTWTVCAIIPPLTARDLTSMLEHITRDGTSMPARCATVKVADRVTARTTIALD